MGIGGLFLLCALLSSSLASSAEPAAPPVADEPPAPPPDTVRLRDGQILRGTLVEVVPADHVTILLPSGERATVPWRDLERIDRAGPAPPAPAAAPPPVPATKKRRTLPKERTVRVHIESSRTVTLQYDNPELDFHWEPICDSPCDKDLPLEGQYRVRGQGITSSQDFALSGSPGDTVTLRLSPGSKAAVTGGAIVIALGGIVGYVGLLAAADTRGESPNGLGLAALGLGAAAIGLGIYLVVDNKRTGVEVGATRPRSESADAAARGPVAWPTARTATIFAGRF